MITSAGLEKKILPKNIIVMSGSRAIKGTSRRMIQH
jgi:hypothetical protein